MLRYFAPQWTAFKNMDAAYRSELYWWGSGLCGAGIGYGYAMREALNDFSNQKFGVDKVMKCSCYGLVGALAGGILGIAALGTSPVWVPILTTTAIIAKINDKPNGHISDHKTSYQSQSKD